MVPADSRTSILFFFFKQESNINNLMLDSKYFSRWLVSCIESKKSKNSNLRKYI